MNKVGKTVNNGVAELKLSPLFNKKNSSLVCSGLHSTTE